MPRCSCISTRRSGSFGTPQGIQDEFDRLQPRDGATSRARPATHDSPLELLTVIGMSLHELEDFYAHSNWVEEPGVTGADGPDWSEAALRHDPDLVRRAGRARG